MIDPLIHDLILGCWFNADGIHIPDPEPVKSTTVSGQYAGLPDVKELVTFFDKSSGINP